MTESAAAARKRRDRKTDQLVMTTLMSTVDGRRWVWLQLEQFGVFHHFDTTSHAEMARQEGARRIGLRWLSILGSHCPDTYIRMTQENTGRKLEELENDGHDDNDQ